MKQIKVLFFLANAGFAGSEWYAIALEKALKKRINVIINFAFFREGPMIKYLQKNNKNVTLLKGKSMMEMRREFSHYDFIFAHQPLAKFYVSFFKLIGLEAKCFIWIHSDPVDFYYHYIKINRMKAIFSYIRTYAIQIIANLICDHTVLVSSYMIKRIFLKRKVIISKNFYSYIERKSNLKKVYDIIYLGGSYDYRKGFSVVEFLITHIKNARWVLVGEYSEIEKNKYREYDVTFPGCVIQSIAQRYIAQSKIIVVPSRNETFGRIVMEGALVYTAVVASNIGGLKEIIKNGETGYLVEKDNNEEFQKKIELLLLDSNRRKIICKKLRSEIINEFSEEKQVGKLIKFIK